MCWELDLLTPVRDADVVDHQFGDRLALEASSTACASRVPTGWTSRAINGTCACALYRCPCDTCREGETSTKDADRLRERGRRKGWSAAKIQRAVAAATAHAPPVAAPYGVRPDVLDHLTELSIRINEFAIVAHFDPFHPVGAEDKRVGREGIATTQPWRAGVVYWVRQG